jgi:hypothetical protein
MALNATVTTCDHLLRDYYLPPFDHELKSEGIVHNCGEPYKLSFLDNDGQLLRPVPAIDAYEAILTAHCENPMCGHRDTTYNYARFTLTGSMLYSRRVEDVVKAVKLTLDSVWLDLKEHLKGVNPPEEDASIAEWLTKKLVEVGGKLHVQKLGGAEWKPQRIIDVADQMGFVQWPHLCLPDEHPLAVAA